MSDTGANSTGISFNSAGVENAISRLNSISKTYEQAVENFSKYAGYINLETTSISGFSSCESALKELYSKIVQEAFRLTSDKASFDSANQENMLLSTGDNQGGMSILQEIMAKGGFIIASGGMSDTPLRKPLKEKKQNANPSGKKWINIEEEETEQDESVKAGGTTYILDQSDKIDEGESKGETESQQTETRSTQPYILVPNSSNAKWKMDFKGGLILVEAAKNGKHEENEYYGKIELADTKRSQLYLHSYKNEDGEYEFYYDHNQNSHGKGKEQGIPVSFGKESGIYIQFTGNGASPNTTWYSQVVNDKEINEKYSTILFHDQFFDTKKSPNPYTTEELKKTIEYFESTVVMINEFGADIDDYVYDFNGSKNKVNLSQVKEDKANNKGVISADKQKEIDILLDEKYYINIDAHSAGGRPTTDLTNMDNPIKVDHIDCGEAVHAITPKGQNDSVVRSVEGYNWIKKLDENGVNITLYAGFKYLNSKGEKIISHKGNENFISQSTLYTGLRCVGNDNIPADLKLPQKLRDNDNEPLDNCKVVLYENVEHGHLGIGLGVVDTKYKATTFKDNATSKGSYFENELDEFAKNNGINKDECTHSELVQMYCESSIAQENTPQSNPSASQPAPSNTGNNNPNAASKIGMSTQQRRDTMA